LKDDVYGSLSLPYSVVKEQLTSSLSHLYVFHANMPQLYFEKLAASKVF
jgi:hypothetical protein